MNRNNSDKKDIKGMTEELRICFESQLSILKSILKEKFDGRLERIRIVAASSCSTGGAICDLGKNPDYFFAEMTMLARSLVEKVTNFCYLILCDDEELKNFERYPYYRMFHNFERQKTAGELAVGLKFTGKNVLRKHPKVVEALSRFSDTNPRMKWSSKNIDQKVSLIHERSKIRVEFFLMNTLTIYSNASEALHGSLYGCTFHLGVFEAGMDFKNPDAVREKVYKETALLFAQLGSMIAETLKLISSIHQINERLKSIEDIEQKTLKLMKGVFDNTTSV